MAPSESEGDEIDDLETENGTSDADGEDEEVDEDVLDNDPDDATEGDDESLSEDSEEGEDEDDDEDSEHSGEDVNMDVDADAPATIPSETTRYSPHTQSKRSNSPPTPQTRERSLSPAQMRKNKLRFSSGSSFSTSGSYTVEAVCAIAHPAPTHALASSFCMSHLLTGSDDGYIRDYDVFAAVNGKSFLTAPQRHHCGVVEGIMKAGQIRSWWENPDMSRFNGPTPVSDDPSISPVYSLLMHSDALWALAGSNTGHINLFTVRHDAGRLCHVMNGHRGPVSALSMEHDEKGYFSAGWDGDAVQWDLNTGQIVRKFIAHGSQLVGIAVRPTISGYSGANISTAKTLSEASGAVHFRPTDSTQVPTQSTSESASGESGAVGNIANTLAADNTARTVPDTIPGQVTNSTQQAPDSDAKSEVSYDPLFDDEPDADGEPDGENNGQWQPTHGLNDPSSQSGPSTLAMPSHSTFQPNRASTSSVVVPKNAPPLLDSTGYSTFSPDVLMTASIDGQIILWDKRVNTPRKGVGRLEMSEKTPPWCVSACWSTNGAHMYAGRRNGTIDVWDVRQPGRSGPRGTPRLLKTLRNPTSSGVVSCVVSFPDGRHIASASSDNIRLWNASDAGEPDASGKTKSGVQFKIIPGHHGGYISQMIVDPAARFLVSASSNRGWHGESSRTIFVHDIKNYHRTTF